jgi:hypothetical protein
MTLQEILKAKGLSNEDIESVIGEMKQNKIFTAAEENLDIRYGKLKSEHDTLTQQYSQANALIDQLKKDTKADEELQGKITSYETQVQSLQKQLAETKLKSALKVALLSEKAEDVDYLTFKLESKLKDENKKLELDENENIKGWKDIVSGLKTQFPNQFEKTADKKIIENKLPNNSDDKVLTKSDVLKMPYTERAKFQSENPTEYETIMKS